MAYEALNNLGHSGRNVIIVLNDNGRSYAPTVSNLSKSLTQVRLNPVYMRRQKRLEQIVRTVPLVGSRAHKGMEAMKAAVREMWEPATFFEPLGVRYMGPVDGHRVEDLEKALRNAAEFDGPIVLHVLTDKGRGYPPAEDDDEKHLHDAPVFDPAVGPPRWVPVGYTQAFAEAMIKEAESNPKVVAITAAMPGPTGLLPFQERWPDRFFDVGIAEQHAVTAATGMAMGGLRPVVAIYSTFMNRAWDQVMYDCALHEQPIVFCLDRAGITGDDGPSTHGVMDIALFSKVPGMTVFAPSSAQELQVMLHDALELDGPSVVRYPRGAARQVPDDQVGSGLRARLVRRGAESEVCLLAVGKLVAAAEAAATELEASGVDCTVWDVRVVKPLDPAMIADAARHPLVVTVEDGVREGGAGSLIADTLATHCAGPDIPRVEVLGTPIRFLPHGKPDRILADLGLDGPGIASTIRAILAS
jgi:1-deoxy-D-xylulose-5-phosphate synthase